MKYASIAALLLIPVWIFAQVPAENGTPKQEKVKVIRLSAKHYRANGQPQLRLSGIKVVPLCPDTTLLGYAQKGMANRAVRAVPDKSYTPYLQDFVNETFSGIFIASGRQMLWVIKDLRINESTNTNTEYAFVRLKADAYLPADNNSQPAYRLLKSYDTVMLKSDINATNQHGKNIAEVIQQFYLACEHAAATESTGAAMTETAIIDNALQRFKSPIFLDTDYKPGVYLIYEEFLANAPAITDFELAEKKRKKLAVYAKEADSTRKELTTLWGVSYQGDLYKYDAGELIPIERRQNAFILSKYISDVNRKNSSLIWGYFGLLSTVGMIGSEITATSAVHLATGMPELEVFKAQATTVDVETGELVF